MNFKLKHSLPLVLLLFLLSDCKKFGKEFDVFFYTAQRNPQVPLHLSIDNANKGILPVIDSKPRNLADSLLQRSLHLKLRSGRYRIEAKTNEGEVVYSGRLIFRTGTLKTIGYFGQHEIIATDKRVVAQISSVEK